MEKSELVKFKVGDKVRMTIDVVVTEIESNACAKAVLRVGSGRSHGGWIDDPCIVAIEGRKPKLPDNWAWENGQAYYCPDFPTQTTACVRMGSDCVIVNGNLSGMGGDQLVAVIKAVREHG